MDRLRIALGLDRPAVVSLVGGGGKTTLMYRLARELTDDGQTVVTTTSTKIFPPRPEQSAHLVLDPDPEDLIRRLRRRLARAPHVTAAARPLPAGGKLAGVPTGQIDRWWRLGVADWILVEADGARCCPLKAPAPHEPVVPAVTRHCVALIGLDGVGRPLTAEWVFRAERFACVTDLSAGQCIGPEHVARVVVRPAGLFQHVPAGARRSVFLNKADTPERCAAARCIAREIYHHRGALPAVVVWGCLRGFPLDLHALEHGHDAIP